MGAWPHIWELWFLGVNNGEDGGVDCSELEKIQDAVILSDVG